MAEAFVLEPRWTAADVARGVSRMLLAEGFSPLTELTLSNGRRLDIAAIGPKGEIIGIEIKISTADLRCDTKWPEYLDYCDLFYFAVPPEFPLAAIPQSAGLVVADCYGGAILRSATPHNVHSARRRSVMLRFAQSAAERLARLRDSQHMLRTAN